MADTPRKTLGLPSKLKAAGPAPDAPVGVKRKPIRGGQTSPNRKTSVKTGESAARPSRPERERPGGLLQDKARGTPSRAPVVPKTGGTFRPTAGKAVASVPQSGVRISKLMAEQGLCSRREADTYIEKGWVLVNGERVTELGTRADPGAHIKLDRGARAAQLQQMTILLHKPVGYVSGQPEPGFTPAVTLIQPESQFRVPGTPIFHPSHLKGLAPAGKLDIDSTGLLVLTQDGRVARQLIGEDSSVDKEYLVRVEGRLDDQGLALLNHGLSLDGRRLKPAKVERLNEDQLRFVLVEGRKRQIRRMCELVGLKAVGLKRVRIGKVMLADLPVGQWRFLRDDEHF